MSTKKRKKRKKKSEIVSTLPKLQSFIPFISHTLLMEIGQNGPHETS